MKVTRDVILDLLPLVLAGEASDDTRALVERYLQDDPHLAQLARQAQRADLPDDLSEDIPVNLTMEDEMKALNKAKRLMYQHNIFLSLAIAFTFLFAMGLTFLLDENPLGPAVFFALAAIFWTAYVLVNRKLNE